MSLNEALQQKLANWRPHTASSSLIVEDKDSGWRAELYADSVDTIGCRLREVVVKPVGTWTCEESLEVQAKGIARRVTGLLEPLHLVEVDTGRGVAQLRSDGPAQKGEDLAYYEVLRHQDGTTTLHRYQASHAHGKREQVPFNLTHEALAKVAGDLAG